MIFSKILGIILPCLIFPVLSAVAFKTIFAHSIKGSGLGAKLKAECPAFPGYGAATPYRITYTGLDPLDSKLCILVAMFHAAMEPLSFPFLTYFLGTAAPLTSIPAVEASRISRHFTIAFPIIIGAFCQTITVGVTMPIYWLCFILTSNLPGHEKTMISQASAESILFSIFIGSIVPSAAMFILKDPTVTAIWQFFPLWASIAGWIHLKLRPIASAPESGYVTIQMMHAAMFVIASSTHAAATWPSLQTKDINALKALFLPSISMLDPATTSAELAAKDLLQWDATFAFGSTILASLWFAGSIKDLLAILAWYTVAIPVVGPGAAITGVLFWRESKLNAQMESLKVVDKDKKET